MQLDLTAGAPAGVGSEVRHDQEALHAAAPKEIDDGYLK